MNIQRHCGYTQEDRTVDRYFFFIHQSVPKQPIWRFNINYKRSANSSGLLQLTLTFKLTHMSYLPFGIYLPFTMWLGTFSQHSMPILLVSESAQDSSDSSLLPPSILSLTLLPNLILFRYWPVRFFIKPVTATYGNTVKRTIPYRMFILLS